MSIPVETFFLDPAMQGTLQARIQHVIATGILSGRFRAGEKLPSSRKLAAHLGVSRITVTLAYNELVSSDYLTARGRSGYFISDAAPTPTKFPETPTSKDAVDWNRALGHRLRDDTALLRKPQDWAGYKYPFIYGQADPKIFDHANWRLCAIQALGQRDFRSMTADQFDQDDPQLVEFILRHTLPRRGISAAPGQILITLGAQNALWIAAQVLLTQRRQAAVEDPCYPPLRDILTRTRSHLMPVPVDADGLPPDAIPDETDVIFTTPSHQSPTNATMPMERRRALLDRAAELGALVVEDDYEFEMSFLRPALPALKSLDGDGRVIYVGSFSKSLFPGLRLGYLVGAEPFIREARALRASILRHPPGHVQRTAAYFLSLGYHDALIRRMGRVLQERRSVMERAIAGAGLDVAGIGAAGGSSVWMQAPRGVDTAVLAQQLAAQSVLIEPGAPFFNGPDIPRHFYRLAYSSIAPERIEPGIKILANAIEPHANATT